MTIQPTPNDQQPGRRAPSSQESESLRSLKVTGALDSLDDEPVRNVDYVVDYYALLGVPPDASIEAIRSAYRNGARGCHPDVLARANDELRRTGARRFALITEAWETLGNPQHRAAYDALLNSFPEELRSKSGAAILDLSRQRVRVNFLLSGQEWSGRAEAEQMLRSLAGVDPASLAVLEQLASDPATANEQNRTALRELLERQRAFLELREEIAWRAAGVHSVAPVERMTNTDDHVQGRQRQLTEVRDEIATRIQSQVAALAAGESVTLLLPAGQGQTDAALAKADGAALARQLTAHAIDRFDRHQQELLTLAEMHRAVLDKLLPLVRHEELRSATATDDRVVILLVANGSVRFGVLAQHDGAQTEIRHLQDVGLPEAPKGPLSNTETQGSELSRFIDSIGTRVVALHYSPELDPWLQLSYIANKLLHDS